MAALINLLILSVVFMLAAAIIPKVKIHAMGFAVLAAGLFGVANVLLGGLFQFVGGLLLFLPALLSCGLAYVLLPVCVNMLLLKLVDLFMAEKLEIEGVGSLAAMAVIVSLAQAVLLRGWVA